MAETNLLKELTERRLRAVAQMREIAQRETPNAEDDATYERASADVTRLGSLIADERKNQAEEAEMRAGLEQALANVGTARPSNVGDDGEEIPSWSDELRTALRNKSRQDRDYELKSPDLRAIQRVSNVYEKRATLNVTTSTQGVELVPDELVNNLFTRVFDDSAVLSAGCGILRTASGETLYFPRITSLGALSMSNARRAESATIQEGEPLFDRVRLDAYKYGQVAKASTEILQDSQFDVKGILGTILGRNMANYLGTDLLTGSGSGQPRGVITVVGSNVITGATGQTGGFGGTVGGDTDEFSKILSVIYLLKPAYRRGAKFLINDLTVGALRKVKFNATTGANSFAWQPGIGANQPDTLFGFPVVVDPFMPAIGLNNVSMVFGDFSNYYVRFVNDLRVEWSTEVAFTTDEVMIRALLRADGDAIDDAAFCGFKGGAS